MRAGVREVNVYGNDIIWVDYDGCETIEQSTQILEEAVTFLTKKNEPSLVIMSFRNAKITSSFLRNIQEESPRISHLIKRIAFVGVGKSKKDILKGISSPYSMDNLVFDSEHEAIEFLIKA